MTISMNVKEILLILESIKHLKGDEQIDGNNFFQMNFFSDEARNKINDSTKNPIIRIIVPTLKTCGELVELVETEIQTNFEKIVRDNFKKLDEFRDPITKKVIQNPVLLKCNAVTYERVSIDNYFSSFPYGTNPRDPVSGRELLEGEREYVANIKMEENMEKFTQNFHSEVIETLTITLLFLERNFKRNSIFTQLDDLFRITNELRPNKEIFSLQERIFTDIFFDEDKLFLARKVKFNLMVNTNSENIYEYYKTKIESLLTMEKEKMYFLEKLQTRHLPVEVSLELVQIYNKNGEYEKGRKLFQKLLSDRKDFNILLKYVEIFREKIEDELQNGSLLALCESEEEKIQFLKKCYEFLPEDEFLLRELVILCYKNGRIGEIEISTEKLTKILLWKLMKVSEENEIVKKEVKVLTEKNRNQSKKIFNQGKILIDIQKRVLILEGSLSSDEKPTRKSLPEIEEEPGEYQQYYHGNNDILEDNFFNEEEEEGESNIYDELERSEEEDKKYFNEKLKSIVHTNRLEGSHNKLKVQEGEIKQNKIIAPVEEEQESEGELEDVDDDDPLSKKVIYLKNLKNIQENDLHMYFGKFGNLEDIVFSNNYGLIEYRDDDVIKNLIHSDDIVINGEKTEILLIEKRQKINLLNVNDDTLTICMTPIPTNCDVKEVFDFFESCGKVMEVKRYDKSGICFIKFFQRSGVENSILDKHGTDFRGRFIDVRIAPTQSPLPLGKTLLKKIFCCNLPFGIMANQLMDFFNEHIGLNSVVSIDFDNQTESCYLTFREANQVEKALSIDGKVSIEGKPIDIYPLIETDRKFSIKVTNLPRRMRVGDVKELFGRCGIVLSVIMHQSGRECIIDYPDEVAMQKAIKLHRIELRGKRILGIEKIE